MNQEKTDDGKDKTHQTTLKRHNTHVLEQFGKNSKMHIHLKQKSNMASILLQHFLISLSIIHTILAQIITSNSHEISFNQIYNSTNYLKIYRITFILIMGLKIILIISLYLEIIYYNKEIAFVSWISNNIIKSFGVLKEIDLTFTAFLCLVNLNQNIAPLLLSAFIYVGYTIYLQNYVVRKELAYCSSAIHSFAFRLCIIVNYLINILFANVHNKTVFSSYYGCLAVMGYIWYVRYGYQIYYYSTVRLIYLILNAAFITVYFKILENLIFDSVLISINEIAKVILIFLLLAFNFSCYLNKFNYNCKEVHLKQFDLYLNRLLQDSFRNPNSNDQLLGLLNYHKKQLNHQQNIYDPFLKTSVRRQDFYLQKQSIVRNYIKKKYQRSIQNSSQVDSNQIYLQYCQFLCNYDLNYYQIHKCISKIDKNSLNILEKIKLNHMKTIVKESNGQISKQLYFSKMPLQTIIQSQNCFGEIENNIVQYIQENIDIWGMMQLQEISFSQFRKTLKNSFQIKDAIANKWKCISNFISFNSKWSFIYLNYRYLINNQRLRQKQLQLILSPKVQSQTIYFQPMTSQKELFNPLILYDQDSFCLRANWEQGDLIIKSVNERFETITGYTKEKVLNCSVNILMPQQLKKEHQIKVNNWLQKGVISNEDQYQIKKTQIVTFQDNTLPAFKYFKCFFGIETGLDYFCLMKINVKGPKKFIVSNQAIRLLSDPKFNTGLTSHEKILKQPCKIENIFAKEQAFEPEKDAKEICYFKVIARFFLVIMLLLVIIGSILSKDTNSNLTSFSNQFISYMSVYRFPVILSTNYMKSFLKVGNQTKVTQQIQGATTNFIASSKNTQIKATLFDQQLNSPKTYYPYYNYSFLANDSRSQIDLFYTIFSSISSLNKLPVNRTSPQYQRFNSYLKPSYDNMMNATKYKLHEKFTTIFKSSLSVQIILIVIELAAFVIFIYLLMRFANSLTQRMDNVLLIITQFGQKQVKQNYNYWKQLQSYFHQLFFQFQSRTANMITAETQNRQSSLKIDQTKVQTNNSSKKIKQDGYKNICIFKIKALIIICTILIIGSVISMQIRSIVQLNKLYDFQQEGFYFLRFFPVGPLVTMGCSEKYYADAYPSEIPFKSQKYDDVISALFIFGSNNYFGDDNINSLYFKKRKSYFFGNPCQYNPSVLHPTGINASTCESICNGTFKQGLSAFLRYEYRLGQDCIRNNVNLTSSELDQFTLGGTVLSAFVLDSISTWLSQFIEKLSSDSQNGQIQSIIVAIVIIIVHLYINQLKILAYLLEQYQLTKKAYNSLVSQALLINQKVIRQKFVIQGIIT